MDLRWLFNGQICSDYNILLGWLSGEMWIRDISTLGLSEYAKYSTAGSLNIRPRAKALGRIFRGPLVEYFAYSLTLGGYVLRISDRKSATSNQMPGLPKSRA